ncbi:hypothetical protein BDW74DRAFT_187360 [Aspergillus multicolor]|uniref:uncharacterized protein n=1 Tax=Aspergillus multicolor TaxID=41759 RepID=UPI003CCD0855
MNHQESSRVTIACETCRKRKRKCDGVQPKCSWCLNRDTECHYITERPAKRKLDRDYVAGLEDQIALLMEEVRRLENLNPTATRPEHIASILDSDDVPEQISQTQPTNDTLSSSTTTAIDDVSALIWRMNIESNGETTLIGPSGNFCFPVAHTDASDDHILGTSPDSKRKSADEIDRLRVHNDLLDKFAKFINPIHQFLDSGTLDKIRGTELGEGLALIKTAAMAAGALYADDAESKAVGDEAAATVDAIAMQVCRDAPGVSIVQTLSIMSWRELGLEQHNMGWMYNSMAGSMAFHLGLSAGLIQGSGSNNVNGNGVEDLEIQSLRLRALWSAVFMDRVATCLLGRTCMIPWRRIQAPPFIDSLGSLPSLDELAFDHHCRLWFIFDQYMDRIYSFEFNKLSGSERHGLLLSAREHLLSFHRHLHPRLHLPGSKERAPASIIFLHMTLNTAQILIHRPYLKEPRSSPEYTLSVRTMATAAAALTRLVRAYCKIGTFDNVPPFIVHSVLTAAVTHLLNATSSHQTLRSQSIARFRVCFDALGAMARRWIKARRGIRLLRELARRWGVMAALPLQNGFENPLESESAPSGAVGISTEHESHAEDSNLADFSALALFPGLAASFDIADISFY